jgi:hypothetical protein
MKKLVPFFLILPVLWFGYLAVDNFTTRPFENVSSVIVGSAVVNNDAAPRVLTIKRTYTVGQSCHIDFVRYMVGGSKTLPSGASFENSPVGDDEIVIQTGWFERTKGEDRADTINLPIFSAYPNGHYQLYSHYSYHCNSLDYLYSRSDLEKLAEFDIGGKGNGGQ